MKHFIGIVPSDTIYQTVSKIQTKFGDNRLEPHITLRPPVQVIFEAEWIRAIEEVCKTFSPFSISLPRTGRFGNRVLFIDVTSEPLIALHNAMRAAIYPFEQADMQEESRPLKPHLTLGRTWCGFTKQDFHSMEALARDYLSTKPVAFEVNFVRIYHKPLHQGRYEKCKDASLALPTCTGLS